MSGVKRWRMPYKGIDKWDGILLQVSGGAVPFIDLARWVSRGAERKEAKDKFKVESSELRV